MQNLAKTSRYEAQLGYGAGRRLAALLSQHRARPTHRAFLWVPDIPLERLGKGDSGYGGGGTRRRPASGRRRGGGGSGRWCSGSRRRATRERTAHQTRTRSPRGAPLQPCLVV